MSRRSKKTSTAPLAVASDGTVLLNMVHADGSRDPTMLLERALHEGGVVFVGVTITRPEQALLLKRMDDATEETAAWIWGRRQRRRRARSRIKRRTVS